jgi:3-hydroxyacyl-CoA dehydrogenase
MGDFDFTARTQNGLGLIEFSDGRELSVTPDLSSAIEGFWSDDAVQFLVLTEPVKKVTIPVDLAKARIMAAPDGIPESLRGTLPALSLERIVANLVRIVRAACRTDELPGVTDQGVEPLPVRRVGVLGAGTMGASIAHAYAAAGCEVLLKEVDRQALDRGIATVGEIVAAQAALGLAGPEGVDAVIARIRPQLDFDGFDDLDLVVESVPEVIELKKLVFAELDSLCAPRTILASNTSSLSIAHMATATTRPNKVVGHHFFHPVQERPLMEIGRTYVTDVETLVTSIAASRLIGKTPIVVPDVHGFLANRVPAPGWLEARLVVEEGASIERVDRLAMDLGQPFGPMHAVDMVGHDVAFLAGEVMREELDRIVEYPAHAAMMYERGRLGVKSGLGYYRYEPGDPTPIPDPEIEEILEEARRERGISRRDDISDAEIVERFMLPTINHGADALADNIAASAADIDVAMVIGYGSPAFLGGPMSYADQWGLATVVSRLQEYERRLGSRFAPSPYLVELAESGAGFYPE